MLRGQASELDDSSWIRSSDEHALLESSPQRSFRCVGPVYP